MTSVAESSGGMGFIHKSKLNSNGSFSVGKSWKLVELRGVEVLNVRVHLRHCMPQVLAVTTPSHWRSTSACPGRTGGRLRIKGIKATSSRNSFDSSVLLRAARRPLNSWVCEILVNLVRCRFCRERSSVRAFLTSNKATAPRLSTHGKGTDTHQWRAFTSYHSSSSRSERILRYIVSIPKWTTEWHAQ